MQFGLWTFVQHLSVPKNTNRKLNTKFWKLGWSRGILQFSLPRASDLMISAALYDDLIQTSNFIALHAICEMQASTVV
jgi:hypothetical protein